MYIVKQDDDGTSRFINEDGGNLKSVDFLENGSTSTNMKNYGLSRLTSTGAVTITLDAPVNGCEKHIVKTANSTAIVTVSSGSTTVFFGASTAANTTMTFNGQNDAVILRGDGTTRWQIMAQNSIAVATT